MEWGLFFVTGLPVIIGGLWILSLILEPYYEAWLRVKHRELDNERRAIELGVPVVPKGFKK